MYELDVCFVCDAVSLLRPYATIYAMHHLPEGQEVAGPLILVDGRAREIPDLTQPLLVDLRRHLDGDRENESL